MATQAQLRSLSERKYRAEGTSLLEPVMQPFWRWLVGWVPLWVAPNLITFVGLVVNIATSLLVVVQDPSFEGKASPWAYMACAIGFFVYQSLDAIDGKQARRTNSATPMGELFDHGCDAISMYLVVVTALSSVAINENAISAVIFTELLMTLNFSYHWQTYVCGVLHFKKIDVTEAQFVHIALLLLHFFLGPSFWHIRLPLVNLPINMTIYYVFCSFSLVNLVISFYIILTSGVGKNGSTVADSSVLSPLTTPLLIIPPAFLCLDSSLLYSNTALYLSGFTLPFVKHIIVMIFSGMSKYPYPLLDRIMVGPWILLSNHLLGMPLPELWLYIIIAFLNMVDILLFCVRLSWQVCDYLGISCFTIPYPPPKTAG